MHGIFLDFQRPNPTTWFYFSLILVVAMFYRFSRFFSLRNLDILTLFGPMPGFLLLLEDRETQGGGAVFAYGWMVACSLYFVIRCLLDLGLERRPPHVANLNTSGLSWMCGALFISLVGISMIPPPENYIGPGVSKFPVEKIRAQGDLAIGNKASEPLSKVRLWTERGLSLGCHLGIVVGLVLVAWRHFDDWQAGMAAATCHLVLPYSFLLTPHNELGVGRWEDTWPMTLILWALFFLRTPTVAGIFMGVAVGTLLFPVIVVTSWLGFYRGRDRYWFLGALLTTSLAGLLVVAFLGLPDSWLVSPDWLPWRQPAPGSESVWMAVPWAWTYRMPVFLIHLALVVLAGFWPQPRNFAHLIAQITCLLAASQWWTADKGGTHVFWFLPLFILMIFRPTDPSQAEGRDFLELEKEVLRKLQNWWAIRQRRQQEKPGPDPQV